jgi:hypothetical protein
MTKKNRRLGVKLSIWLLTTKSQKLPWFSCVKVACHIFLERSRQGLQLSFISHLNWRFLHKVMGLQSRESPHFENFETRNLGGLTKWHLGVGPVAKHGEYYKGEGGGFPQVQAMVSLVNTCLLVDCLCTISVQLCTNQLVV